MKIDQFYTWALFVREEDILRFQVHVNQVCKVKVIDSTYHFLNNLCSLKLGHEIVFIDMLLNIGEQISTMTKFCNYVVVQLILKEILEA